MIKVERLVYEYPGKRALDNVSFEIRKGSITALVGPNGAGKTTLLRCIAALDEPMSGYLSVAGMNVAEHPREVHKAIGYLSDSFGLYQDLTVRQCLFFSARLHQLSQPDVEQQVAWAIQLLGLEPYQSVTAGTLSRGWRQRLGIAQAIIHKPQLLLLDEPASGLDPEARLALSDLFRNLASEGMTLLVSSHILAELEDYCTDMLILRDGKIIEHCVSKQNQPEFSLFVQLIGSIASCKQLLEAQDSVRQVVAESTGIRCVISGNEETQHNLLKALIEAGVKVYGFYVKQERLQDVYMSLGGGQYAN